MPSLYTFDNAPPTVSKRFFESCYLTKVFLPTKQRNAFWGFWSHRPISSLTFTHSFARAQELIEKKRKGGQGSSYLIFEVPACVFTAGTQSMVVVDNSSQRPFETSAFAQPSTITLADIASSLSATNKSLYYFWYSGTDLRPARLPFVCHKSFTDSSVKRLGWQRADPSVEHQVALDAIMALLSRITLWRQAFHNGA